MNQIQEYLLKTYCEREIFEHISEKTTDISLKIKALNAILCETKLGKKRIKFFKKHELFDPILTGRIILAHPFPQNRSYSSVVVSNPIHGLVYYQNEAGEIVYEEKGLFNLNIRNNDTAPEITRESIVFFIRNLIETEIYRYEGLLKQENDTNENKEATIELTTQSPTVIFSAIQHIRTLDNDAKENEENLESLEISLSSSEDANNDIDFNLQLNDSCMQRTYNRLTQCNII